MGELFDDCRNSRVTRIDAVRRLFVRGPSRDVQPLEFGAIGGKRPSSVCRHAGDQSINRHIEPDGQPVPNDDCNTNETEARQHRRCTILKCETDLLWFGGIGTYVRASAETEADAGDRANDALRVTGAELRAKVVGEGANLGMTQRGRIEFAARGGRLNTDFIDNSAGVNTSDQEVNIKIALGPAVRTGRLTTNARNALLTEMTEDVAAASLRNNYQQSLALSLAERRSVRDLPDYPLLMRALEARGLLDRPLEALPSDEDLLERARAGRGLKRPELAVLLSYSKIALSEDLLDSSVPDEPLLESLAFLLLPRAAARALCRRHQEAHPAPRDHRHRAHQCHRQPRRPGDGAADDGRDRARQGRRRACVHRGARGVRAAAAVAAHR